MSNTSFQGTCVAVLEGTSVSDIKRVLDFYQEVHTSPVIFVGRRDFGTDTEKAAYHVVSNFYSGTYENIAYIGWPSGVSKDIDNVSVWENYSDIIPRDQFQQNCVFQSLENLKRNTFQTNGLKVPFAVNIKSATDQEIYDVVKALSCHSGIEVLNDFEDYKLEGVTAGVFSYAGIDTNGEGNFWSLRSSFDLTEEGKGVFVIDYKDFLENYRSLLLPTSNRLESLVKGLVEHKDFSFEKVVKMMLEEMDK